MPLNPALLDVLACPKDRGPLLYLPDEDRLYNAREKRSYSVREGIAVLLIEESTLVDDAEHTRIMTKVESQGITPNWTP